MRVRAKMNSIMDEIIVRILHISLIKEKLSFVTSFVDLDRKEKARRFINEKDQLLSLGSGYLMKKYLPQEEIKKTETGKPYLVNGPFFNVSHSGEYVVFVSHQSRDVGVDIEKIDSNKIDGILYVLDEEEKKVNDVKTYFQMWSNKESVIKCLSSGLKDIKNVKGLPLEGNRVINNSNYYTKSTIYDGYSLSVTLKGKEPFIIKIERIYYLKEQ